MKFPGCTNLSSYSLDTKTKKTKKKIMLCRTSPTGQRYTHKMRLCLASESPNLFEPLLEVVYVLVFPALSTFPKIKGSLPSKYLPIPSGVVGLMFLSAPEVVALRPFR